MNRRNLAIRAFGYVVGGLAGVFCWRHPNGAAAPEERVHPDWIAPPESLQNPFTRAWNIAGKPDGEQLSRHYLVPEIQIMANRLAESVPSLNGKRMRLRLECCTPDQSEPADAPDDVLHTAFIVSDDVSVTKLENEYLAPSVLSLARCVHEQHAGKLAGKIMTIEVKVRQQV